MPPEKDVFTMLFSARLRVGGQIQRQESGLPFVTCELDTSFNSSHFLLLCGFSSVRYIRPMQALIGMKLKMRPHARKKAVE